MWPLVVVHVAELVEALLLALHGLLRRPRRFGFERTVHPLVCAVLLRVPGTIRSIRMPRRIHQSDRRETLAKPRDPNGLPLSERIARGSPYSRKMRSKARRVCGPSFDGYASQASR